MFKKLTATVLSLCLILTIISSNIFATNVSGNHNENGFEVVQNDEHIVKVKGEHNGDVLYATLNRDTNEYTMETLEKPKGFFAAMTATKSVYTEYSVNVGIIDGDVVDAVIVNKVTGEELSLEQNTDKVSAQLPALIPVITWGGSALLAFLLEQAAAIAIGAITAYVITDLISDIKKQSQYNYWAAWVRRGDVYLNPEAFPNDNAAFTYLKSANSGEINLFARTSSKAQQAARQVAGFALFEAGNNSEGNYPHYHPTERTGERFSNHVWYYPGT